MASYVIQHKLKENTFWSNEHGWTGIDEATFFTEKERKETDHIPADSVWQPLWRVRFVKFAKAIAEYDDVNANVAYVAVEMGLDIVDIVELLERARNTFGQFKSKHRK